MRHDVPEIPLGYLELFYSALAEASPGPLLFIAA